MQTSDFVKRTVWIVNLHGHDVLNLVGMVDATATSQVDEWTTERDGSMISEAWALPRAAKHVA